MICDTCPLQGPATPRAMLGGPLVPCAAILSALVVPVLAQQVPRVPALCVPFLSCHHPCVPCVCAAIPGVLCPPWATISVPWVPSFLCPVSSVCCHPWCPVPVVPRVPCPCIPPLLLSRCPPCAAIPAPHVHCAPPPRLSICVANPVPCPLCCPPCVPCPAIAAPPRPSVSLQFPRSSPVPPRVPSPVPVSPPRHGAAGRPVPGVHGLRALAGRATPRPGRRRALLPPPALPRLLRARGRPGRGAAGAPSLPLLRCRCVATARGQERDTGGTRGKDWRERGPSHWDFEGQGNNSKRQGGPEERMRSVAGRGQGGGRGE